jgi:hypothetical protein
MLGIPLYANDDKIDPKEPGVYIKTNQGLQGLLPNIVFNERGLVYIKSNNPAHFLLEDAEYFVFFGKYDFKFLTINPMLSSEPSSLGKARFIFGKDVDFDIKQIGVDLYTVKPKGLFGRGLGRGYFSLWINDTAWDFILD